MSEELAIARSGPASEHAAPCLNCGAVPLGPWCQQCGQKAGHAHRSMLHLGAEFVETLTHADGRVWRTMRRLVLDPARLTRDYLEGHRIGEIPPLRMFFVMLFLLFGVSTLSPNSLVHVNGVDSGTRQQAHTQIDRIRIGASPRATGWLHTHLEHAIDHPNDVLRVMREWAERFAFLMLPIAAGTLWVLYLLPPRGYSLFDHMIFSIHSLSFASLVLIATILAERLLGDVAGLLLLLLPVHLFVHMRGLYRAGVAGTLLRMMLLAMVSGVGFAVLMVALAGIGLQFGDEG